MFRRFGISLTLLFAFLLVQGHNLIPHHHTEEAQHTASHHHGHHHQHEHDSEESDDPEPFHGTHQADFGKVLVKANELKELLLKPSLVFLLTAIPELKIATEDPPLIRPPVTVPIQRFLHAYSVPLRAPPVLFTVI